MVFSGMKGSSFAIVLYRRMACIALKHRQEQTDCSVVSDLPPVSAVCCEQSGTSGTIHNTYSVAASAVRCN
jgi:hypothetical protein